MARARNNLSRGAAQVDPQPTTGAAVSGATPGSLNASANSFAPQENADNDDPNSTAEGPHMLFARIAEPPAAETEQADDRGSVYLGEAFSLAFVVKTVCSPSGHTAQPTRLHYGVPQSVTDRGEMEEDTKAFLQASGAFEVPEKTVLNAMTRTFFECMHPAYPVINRKAFEAQYREGNVSLLLLQTILFLAATMCEDHVVHQAGFTDKYHARRVFYRRAKALYDADYEKDKTTLAAVLFLFSFWWQKPQDQKDTWHWIGCAVSLAQALGMHRSTATSGFPSTTRSLWKRIWWSIYVRERHAAAALGRPSHICDDDCDVEPLTREDLEVDYVNNSPIICGQELYHVGYAIAMSRLAFHLGHLLSARFSPGARSSRTSIERIARDLEGWEHALPPDLVRGPVRSTLSAPFWACMLHANYHNCMILLLRPNRIVLDSDEQTENDLKISVAADEITRIAEDLLAAGTVRQGQVHMVPALFAALGVHATVIRKAHAIRRLVAENRSRQCMLALSELSQAWPVAVWILRLFINLMSRLTSRDFRNEILPMKNQQASTVHRSSLQDEAASRPMVSSTLHERGMPSPICGSSFADAIGDLPYDYDWADLGLFNLDLMFDGSVAGTEPYSIGL